MPQKHKHVPQPQKMCKICGKPKTTLHRTNYVDGKPVCYNAKLSTRNRRHGFMKKRPHPTPVDYTGETYERQFHISKGIIGVASEVKTAVRDLLFKPKEEVERPTKKKPTKEIPHVEIPIEMQEPYKEEEVKAQ